jgi:hypothetical protein
MLMAKLAQNTRRDREATSQECRHCERSEAIHSFFARQSWIASLALAMTVAGTGCLKF